MLFFGCRGQEDDIYADELARWEDEGIVSVRRAYSRVEKGSAYVQDQILAEKGEVIQMWKNGARVYICGSRKMAKAVEDVCVKVLRDSGEGDKGLEWWTSRFAADVFD